MAREIENGGRLGFRNLAGGPWRSIDSRCAISDASLLIARGLQAAGDAVVYHHFCERDDPGRRGFRALSKFDVAHAVDMVFRDGNPATEFCAPCGP